MPIKVVSVDNVIRNNHFYYFRKFMLLQQKNVIDHVNVCFMFNVISIKDLEDVTTILLPIVLIHDLIEVISKQAIKLKHILKVNFE